MLTSIHLLVLFGIMAFSSDDIRITVYRDPPRFPTHLHPAPPDSLRNLPSPPQDEETIETIPDPEALRRNGGHSNVPGHYQDARGHRVFSSDSDTSMLPSSLVISNSSSFQYILPTSMGFPSYRTRNGPPPANIRVGLNRRARNITQYRLLDRSGRECIGNWILETVLGAGAWGLVYLARHVDNNTQAAIKIISKERTNGARFAEWHEAMVHYAKDVEDFDESVQREVAILKLLDHPNIVKLLEMHENRFEMQVSLYSI